MLKEISVPRICNKCRGEGVWTEPENMNGGPYMHDPCPGCNGSGYQDFYQLVLPNNYFWATDVFNCIVPSEYANLGDPQREFVSLILSLGICDLRGGSHEKVILWEVFGAGTDTRKNLKQLLKEN